MHVTTRLQKSTQSNIPHFSGKPTCQITTPKADVSQFHVNRPKMPSGKSVIISIETSFPPLLLAQAREKHRYHTSLLAGYFRVFHVVPFDGCTYSNSAANIYHHHQKPPHPLRQSSIKRLLGRFGGVIRGGDRISHKQTHTLRTRGNDLWLVGMNHLPNSTPLPL